MNNKDILPEIGFIRIGTVLKIIPVSKSTWWLGVKSGRFPKPVKFSPGVSMWSVKNIRNLVSKFENE